ncbi:MAG: hypothetical protein GYB67_09765 [Chloroflexi bacterium]|nr:hypothetical protein [Chloroflexota bacterium]
MMRWTMRGLLTGVLLILVVSGALAQDTGDEAAEVPMCDQDSYLRVLQSLVPGTVRAEAQMGYVLPADTPDDFVLPTRGIDEETGLFVIRATDGTLLSTCVPSADLVALEAAETIGVPAVDIQAGDLRIRRADGDLLLLVVNFDELTPEERGTLLVEFYAWWFGLINELPQHGSQ